MLARLNSTNPPEKTATGAGILIYDRDEYGQINHMVMPYNDGRFSDEGLTEGKPARRYVLPKGGVDAGESNLQAAWRETAEETGIDPLLLLCATEGEVNAYQKNKDIIPEAANRLNRGETLAAFDSAGYPGVRVKQADATPQLHCFTCRVGNEISVAMFGLEVESISALRPHVKNAAEQTKRDAVAARDLPSFETMLSWMRAGEIPSEHTGGDAITLHDKHWLSRMETLHASQLDFLNRDSWRVFCENIQPGFDQITSLNNYAKRAYEQLKKIQSDPTLTPEDSERRVQEIADRIDRFADTLNQQETDIKTLWSSFAKIKNYLLDKGVINGDADVLKFDVRDCPLHFFVEGASIIPASELMEKIFLDLDHDRDYARAFGGQAPAALDFPPAHRITHSTVAAMGNFVDPKTISAAFGAADSKVASLIPRIPGKSENPPSALRWAEGLPRNAVVSALCAGAVTRQVEGLSQTG